MITKFQLTPNQRFRCVDSTEGPSLQKETCDLNSQALFDIFYQKINKSKFLIYSLHPTQSADLQLFSNYWINSDSLSEKRMEIMTILCLKL